MFYKRKREEDPPDAEAGATEASMIGGGPAPTVVRREGKRFLSEPPAGSQVVNDDTYSALENLFQGRPERIKFRLAIFRLQEPDTAPGEYLGRIPMPNDLLEEVIARRWGPGHYRWQLSLTNRFAGAKDLPSDLRDLPLEGFVSVDAEIAAAVGWDGRAPGPLGEIPEILPAPPDPMTQVLALVKENQERDRQDRRESSNSMVQMMGMVLQGVQAQANQAAELARQQSQFLLGQLQLAEVRHKEQRSEKDEMWKQMVDIFRETGGPRGEAADPALKIVEQLPSILQLLGDFGRQNPAAVKKGLPAPAPAPVPASAPAPAQTGGQTVDEALRSYVAAIAGRFHEDWKATKTADEQAEALANLGSDEQYEWLLDQDDYMILATLNQLYQKSVGQRPPKEFSDRAVEVLRILREDAVDVPVAPDAPALAPAPAPAPAPPPVQAPPAAPAPGTAPPVQ